jgi:hypothetical protein
MDMEGFKKGKRINPTKNYVEVVKSECILVQDLMPHALRARTRNPLMLSLCVKS